MDELFYETQQILLKDSVTLKECVDKTRELTKICSASSIHAMSELIGCLFNLDFIQVDNLVDGKQNWV